MNKKSLLLKLVLISFTLLIAAAGYSQVLYDCSDDQCTAEDLQVGAVYLANEAGDILLNSDDYTCTPGTPTSIYLKVLFSGNTSAERYSLLIYFDVYIDGVFSQHIQNEYYPIHGILPGQYHLLPEPVTWTCGSKMELRNLYMSWQSNPGQPLECGGSKCSKVQGPLVVYGPLVADFDVSKECLPLHGYETVTFTSTTTGGFEPYSFTWYLEKDGTEFTNYDILNGGTLNSEELTLSFKQTVVGLYVKLTVNDARTPTPREDDEMKTIDILACCDLQITNDASDKTVECDGAGNTADLNNWLETHGGATAVDNGGGSVTWSNDFKALSDQCGATGSATVIFTATDVCGNTKTTSATFKIEDTTAPSITTPASDKTVECDGEGNASDLATWLGNHGGAVATDDCGGVTWTYSPASPEISDLCGATGLVEVTFRATDDCGLYSETKATFTINDNVAPLLTGTLPVGETGMNLLYSEIPAGPTESEIAALYSDDCGTVHVKKSGAPEGSDCSWRVTYTYAVTDDCGNSVTPDPEVTYSGGDITAPVWVTKSGELDVTVECNDVDGLAAAQALFPVAQDNSGNDVTDMTKTPGVFVPGTCPDAGTYTNTWTVKDECGLESMVYTQVITITDTKAPELKGSLPTGEKDMNLCFGDIPVGPSESEIAALYSDLCGTVKVTKSGTPTGTDCSWSVTYSYVVTDDCGNRVTPDPEVTYSGGDNSSPTWITVAGALDVTLECSDASGLTAAQAMYPVATDNCDADVTDIVKVSGEFAEGSCPYAGTYTNTWTVTDACKNVSSTYTQIITITDNTAPELTGIWPSGETGINECLGDIPEGPSESEIAALYTEACGTIHVVKSGTPTGNACSWSVTYTYTITDDCSNQVLPAPTITYSGGDKTPPTIGGSIPPSTIEGCDASDAPAAETTVEGLEKLGLTISDNCTPNAELKVTSQDGTSGTCPIVLVRTYHITDNCGNSSQYSQIINLDDTQAPVLSGVPEDINVECDAIPPPAEVTATDNCDTDVRVVYQDQIGVCNNNGKTVNASGNGIVWDIEISETGLKASDISWLSLIFEVNKGKGVAEFTLVSPSGQGVMLVGPYCNTGECILPNEPHTVYMPVFYKCSEGYDKWMNSSNIPSGVEMKFSPYGGTSSPNSGYLTALLAGEGVTWQGYVSCFDDLEGDMDGTWRIYSRKQETDIGDLKFIGACLVPGQCPQNYTITRTWKATDDCGNEAVASQMITVQDVSAPIFEKCPASINLDYPELPNEEMAIDAVGEITDNCGTADVKAVGGAITDTENACVKKQIWTVTAVDECGNTATCEVTFTIAVTEGVPVFFGCPEEPIDLGCNPDPPECGDALELVTVTDGCTGNSLVPECSAGDVVSDGCSRYQIFTLTAKDNLGHSSSCDVKFVWKVDVSAPVLPELPKGGDLGCNPAVLPTCAEDLMAMDECDGLVPVTCEPGIVTGQCNKSQTFTYTAKDECGNTSSKTVTYTWKEDRGLPVISTTAINNSNLGCNPVVTAPPFTGLDNCDGVFSPNVTTTGSTNDGCLYKQTWIANYTDNCGNQAVEVEVTYYWTEDKLAPVITTSAVSGDLGNNPVVVPPVFTGLDNCLGEFKPVVTTGGATHVDCAYTQSWKATFTDDCDNEADPVTITYTWTVGEGTPAISGCPSGPIDLGCNPVRPTCTDAMNQVTFTDGCNGTPDPKCVEGDIKEDGCQLTQTFTLTLGENPETMATCMVTFTWSEDKVAPVVDGEELIDLGCNPVNPTWQYVTPTAKDNCGIAEIMPGYPVKTNIVAEGCIRWKTLTWVFVDECGNESVPFVQKLIWTVDPLAPTVTGKTKITLGCNPANPESAFEAPVASDDCGVPVLKDGYPKTSETNSDGCKMYKTRTWIFVDACGNESLPFTQTVKWFNDDEPPVVTGENTVTLECNPVNPTWQYVTPTASDNCGEAKLKEGYPVKTNIVANGCERSKTLTWIYVDECGNESEPFVQKLIWTVDLDDPEFFECPSEPIDLGSKPEKLPDEAMAITAAGMVNDICGTVLLSAIGGPVEGKCVLRQSWIVTAEDGCGNEATCTVVFTWEDDCGLESHCTYTQGFYGNEGSKTCDGKTALDLMLAAFEGITGDIVPFGDISMPSEGKYFMLFRKDITDGSIFNMLPGGGTPASLQGIATYGNPPSWNLVPLSTKESTKGKILNNLLSQTIVLWFNLRNDPGLGDLVIEDKFMITQKMSECGTNVPVKDSYVYTEIPVEVINYLKAHSEKVDVNSLLALANKVLCGEVNAREVSASKMNAAVDAINTGFDECRILVGFSSTQPDQSVIPHATSISEGNGEETGADNQNANREFSDAFLKVYPNPFSTIVKFELNIIFDTHVRLEIYSHNGAYIGLICDEDLKQGDVRIIEFDASKYPHTTFLYKLTTPYSIMSGTVIRTRQK